VTGLTEAADGKAHIGPVRARRPRSPQRKTGTLFTKVRLQRAGRHAAAALQAGINNE